MESVVIRCPECRQYSRVEADTVGLTVSCPSCSMPYVAQPDPEYHPVVQAVRQRPNRRSVPEPKSTQSSDVFLDQLIPEHPPHTTGIQWAMALIPLGVPLMWLTLAAMGRKPAVFSFAVPVALAIGFCGLCAGIASINRWSLATRVRIMGIVIAISYTIASVLFLTQPKWIERLNNFFDKGLSESKLYIPEDQSYQIRFPGNPSNLDESPFASGEWKFKGVKFVEAKELIQFTSAHASLPRGMPVLSDDKLYNMALDEILADTHGKLIKTTPISTNDYKARDFEIEMPADQVKRIVRVVYHSTHIYYLSVEGTFLTHESPRVKDFFRSFKITKR